MTPIKQIIKDIAKIFRKHGLTYDQSRYIFREARKEAGLKPVKQYKKVVKHLSQDEAEQLIRYAYKDSSKHGIMFQIMLFTGVRVNELVNIRIEDIYFGDNKILIREGKGSKERYVPLFPFLEQSLRLFIGERKTGYVFMSKRLDKYSTRRIQQIVKDIVKKAGIEKKIHPHTFRHTFATWLRDKGQSLEDIQMLLGHSDRKTTEIYAHASIDQIMQRTMKLIEVDK